MEGAPCEKTKPTASSSSMSENSHPTEHFHNLSQSCTSPPTEHNTTRTTSDLCGDKSGKDGNSLDSCAYQQEDKIQMKGNCSRDEELTLIVGTSQHALSESTDCTDTIERVMPTVNSSESPVKCINSVVDGGVSHLVMENQLKGEDSTKQSTSSLTELSNIKDRSSTDDVMDHTNTTSSENKNENAETIVGKELDKEMCVDSSIHTHEDSCSPSGIDKAGCGLDIMPFSLSKTSAPQLDCFKDMPIKEEPLPADSGVSESNSQASISTQNYRNALYLVNYSDSDNESSSSSVSSLSSPCDDNNDSDGGGGPPHGSSKSRSRKDSDHLSSHHKLRSIGEVFPEELPPIDYLAISVPEEVELVQLGTVSGIVDVLVVIKALVETPALYDDTVLFLENRQPLGWIFETFGTVDKTFYSIRFNSEYDIKEKCIAVGDKIFYAPKADNLTKYIFISELRKLKADDASWEHDNEAPEGARDFSDDEEERRVKRKRNPSKLKRCRQDMRADQDTGELYTVRRNSNLKQGDLTRNPFGNQNQKYGNQPSNRNRQNTDLLENAQTSKEGPQVSKINTNSPQPSASFGGKPAWNQPGLMGPGPGTAGVFSNGMQSGNFSRNQPSFPIFRYGSNTPPRQFCASPINESVQRQSPCPFPDFTRPPPSMMPGFSPPNQFRPNFTNNRNSAPPFSSPTFPPFPMNANASVPSSSVPPPWTPPS